MNNGILDLIPTPEMGEDPTALIDGAPMSEQDKMAAAVKGGLMPDPAQMMAQMQAQGGAPGGGIMPGGPPGQMPPQGAPMPPQPQGLAGGGEVAPGAPAGGGQFATGLIKHPSPGRADAIDAVARVGSYVIPADVVSALGEGNTDAGAKFLEQGLQSGNLGFADGGIVPDDAMEVKLSGGEFVFPPEDVAKIGGGDAQAGAELLDQLVSSVRERTGEMAPNMPEPR